MVLTIAADVAAGRADSISIISDVPGWRRLRHWEGRVLRNLSTPETVLFEAETEYFKTSPDPTLLVHPDLEALGKM